MSGRAENIRITVDGRLLGQVHLVIHELLHIYFEEQYGFARKLSDEIEEPMVVSLTRTLSEYLESPHRSVVLASWTKAIQRKLV